MGLINPFKGLVGDYKYLMGFYKCAGENPFEDKELFEMSKKRLEYWGLLSKKYSGFKGYLKRVFTYEGIIKTKEAEVEDRKTLEAVLKTGDILIEYFKLAKSKGQTTA